MKLYHILFSFVLWLSFATFASAQSLKAFNNHPNDAFFQSQDAQRIGDQLLLWQRETGGWPKNVDMVTPMTDSLRNEVLAQKGRRDDSTIDNDATSQQMIFLAHLYRNTKEERFQKAFLQGVEFLLSGQYPNGGWPQFWPAKKGYQWHITYNDDAMVNVMKLIRDIASQVVPYDGSLTDDALRKRLTKAFDKGVDCILATQIVVDGQPTIWCQQHDHETLLPAPARAYELASYCPVESASIVQLLMQLPHPDERICRSIEGAMEWFDRYQLRGIRVERFRNEDGQSDVRVVADEKTSPIWARFYDLQTLTPFFCDRDGIPRVALSEIGYERRTGYSWYNNRPAQLFPLFKAWKERNGRN